jgi:hypothetical protein
MEPPERSFPRDEERTQQEPDQNAADQNWDPEQQRSEVTGGDQCERSIDLLDDSPRDQRGAGDLKGYHHRVEPATGGLWRAKEHCQGKDERQRESEQAPGRLERLRLGDALPLGEERISRSRVQIRKDRR